MECIIARYKPQVRSSIPMVSPIFHAMWVFGRHQIMGNASGPTQPSAITIEDVRKYQGSFTSAWLGGFEPSRNSPQCLHFMAASWISSAQKGHIFIFNSLDKASKEHGRPHVSPATFVIRMMRFRYCTSLSHLLQINQQVKPAQHEEGKTFISRKASKSLRKSKPKGFLCFPLRLCGLSEQRERR